MNLSYLSTHLQTPDENIEIQLGEHVCCLAFTRHGDSHDPYPLYDLDIFIDNVPMYKIDATNWGVAQLLRIVRGVLNALDGWCQHHCCSYLTTFNCDLYRLHSVLRRRGYACDGRMDTWITYIDREGQRVLLKGMLNLIEDKLAINDLWRVAKDTDYYLGRPFTPVDWLKQILS